MSKYIIFTIGDTPIDDASNDLRSHWIPAAESAINGDGPYSGSTTVKPPLWIYLITIANQFGIFPILLGVVFLSNSTIILQLEKWLSDFDLDREVRTIALILISGGIVFMHIEYWIINNKAIAVAIFLISIQSNNYIRMGMGIAIAGLFAQQIVLAIPAVVIYYIENRKEFLNMAVGGLVVVTLSYLSVAAIWDTSEFLIAVNRSLLMASSSYVAGVSDFGAQVTLWGTPVEWIYRIYKLQKTLIFPAIFAVIGLAGSMRSQKKEYKFFSVLLLSFIILLAIRPWWHYAYFPLVPLSVMGGIGVINYRTQRE